MAEIIVNVTDATFDTEVLQSKVPVIVDFWAPWCGPCRVLAPVLETIAPKYEGKAKIVKMNIDENEATPAKFNILSIPTLIFFKDGDQVSTITGAVPATRIESELQKYL